jgi:biopolymer transport protein ExbD
VGIAVLAAACGSQKRIPMVEAIVAPVIAEELPAASATGRLVVGITRGGHVLLGSGAVSLDEVATALDKRSYLGVDIRADRHAAWVHVQWLMCVLAESGVTNVRFLVRAGRGDDATEGGVPVRVHSGYLEDVLSPVPGDAVLVQVLPDADNHAQYVVYSRGGKGATGDSQELAALLRRVRSQERGPVRLAIEGHTKVVFKHCVAALDAANRAGYQYVEWGARRPHPWIRRQIPIPKPNRSQVLARWVVTDLNTPPLVPMTLPVALSADRDSGLDLDDRLIVNLDSSGSIIVENRPVSSDEFIRALANAKREYDVKRKRLGESGFERLAGAGSWARILVLLRAHKDTRWHDVQRVLKLLLEHRIYKLQIAVTRIADLSYSAEEAARLAIPRENLEPGPGDTLTAKLPAFLMMNQEVFVDATIDIAIRVLSNDRVEYEIDTFVTDRTEALKDRVRETGYRLRNRRFVVGGLRANAETPFKFVVVVLDALTEVGVGRFDLGLDD